MNSTSNPERMPSLYPQPPPAQGLPSQPHWPKPLHRQAQPMSCFPCPFERGSSGEWPQGPWEQTLKGRGSWNWQPGLFEALQVRLPPFLAPGNKRGGGERASSSGTHAHPLGLVSQFSDTMPHLCPAPKSLCPMSPGMGQGLLTSGRRPVMRAKGHQTTCPERQALRGGVWRWDRETSPWDYLIPPGGTLARELSSAHSLPLCLKCHHLRNHTMQSIGSWET